jgi:hypothetical protein
VTALLIFGIVAVILIVGFCVAVTVLVSRALTDVIQMSDRMHKRSTEEQDKLLDRLVAIDWERYAALQTLKEPDEGGFEVPGEDDSETTVVRTNWGKLLHERTELTADEEVLLAEDFPDERTRST